MGKESTKIRFQDEHIQIFSALSFDANPLHLDPDYSRAPCGKPVVFGMAATLSALSHWSEGKAFSLGMIRRVFLKPIFLIEYEWQAQEKRSGRKCLSGKGRSVYIVDFYYARK